MISIAPETRVWLVTGHTDMRKGYGRLSLIVQETLRHNPNGGHLFVFRGRRGDLIKILWHDGQGQCLFVKRLSDLLTQHPEFIGPFCLIRHNCDHNYDANPLKDHHIY